MVISTVMPPKVWERRKTFFFKGIVQEVIELEPAESDKPRTFKRAPKTDDDVNRALMVSISSYILPC